MNYPTILAFVSSLTFCCCLRAAPIHKAAIAGDRARVRSLLAVDPTLADAKGAQGLTPLFLAAGNGHLEVVKLQLEKGANSNVEVQGLTTLRIAEAKDHKEIAELLRKAGAK